MASRLRVDPEKIYECCLEITAPEVENKKEATIKFIYPPDFNDEEALKQIPDFCYPCISTSDAVQSYTFVLTDLQSQYRFGFCRYSPNVKTCLCILSYFPWFETFYVLLNTISELKKKTEKDLVIPLLDALLKRTPPNPGVTFKVKPHGCDKEYSFKTPDTTKLPSIPENHNLTDYYAHIDPMNMIHLFVSMFFERRIIITSKKLSLLTACTYGAASLLYPMHWQHIFIPIMPPHLLDYCCAPMPFLIGVHASLMQKVYKMPLDEVVILDADTNEIDTPFHDCAKIPQDVILTLKSTLKKTVYPIEDHVSKAFLCAMVSLVGSYRNALRFKPGERIIFDKDAFIQSKSTSKGAFLETVLQLQLFDQFIGERLDLLNSGQGFNDLFEEQIGLQAEDQKKLKHQYKIWKRQSTKYIEKAMKSSKYGFNETKTYLMGVKKEAKKGLIQLKDNIGEKLRGKEDEEIGGELKKSNSLPYMKHYGIGAKISPITRRKALSPQARKAHSFHQENDVRRPRPKRPPPPNVRDRTNAMSLVLDSDLNEREMPTRHSTPDLKIDPPIAKLVSIDSPEEDKTNEDDKRSTLLDLSEALQDEQVNEASSSPPSDKIENPASTQPANSPKPSRPSRNTSSGKNPNRPKVPPRPSLSRKTSGSSDTSDVRSGQHSPATPTGFVLTPLRHLSIDLHKDILTSLGPDFDGFFPNAESQNSTNTSESSPTLVDGLTNSVETKDKHQKNNVKENEPAGKNINALDNSSPQIDKKSVTDELSEVFNSNDVEKKSDWVNFE
ncbi:DENN domain-containing protein 1A-like [Actinia tenebrosa]|uniref:DENN domain-containing protein 1A-like n=1 Tax=Actinia tenebrosa TaxID=6105 RepID=A0A6P8IRB3_ACTTE|nr:DENN domain-containing protein 1A-like [Actinia tenebrosa]